MVVFTGKESKLMLNNLSIVFKRSNVDRIVDKVCIVYIIRVDIHRNWCVGFVCYFCTSSYPVRFFFVFSLLLDGMSYLHFLVYEILSFNQTSTGKKSWYLGFEIDDQNHELGILTTYFTFLILLDLMVPISLYVSLEFAKFGMVIPA